MRSTSQSGEWRRGVAAVPGTLFFPDGRGADSLRLSSSLVDEEKIDEGIACLGSRPRAESDADLRSR